MNKPYNHLILAEISEEENFNMIDGVINNVKKSSVLRRINELEQQKANRETIKIEREDENVRV